MERVEDDIQIPQEIDLQKLEDEISEDIKNMIMDQQKKMKKREKNRMQKQKKKLRQLRMWLRETNRIYNNQEANSQTKQRQPWVDYRQLCREICQILPNPRPVIKKTSRCICEVIQKTLDEFWKDVQQTDEIEQFQVDFQKYAIHHKILMLKFYRVLAKLEQSNNQIVKLLGLFFERSPDIQRENKYSVNGLIMSEYIYLVQQDTSLREIIRTWKSMEKNEMDLDMNAHQENILNNFNYDRYYEAFEMVESESKKDNLPKIKRKRKNKKKQQEQEESQSSKSQQKPLKLTQQEIEYNNCLYRMSKIGQRENKVKIKLSKDFMEKLKSK